MDHKTMKNIFLFFSKQDSLKKKMTIIGIWLIALVLPIFTLKIMFLGQMLIPHSLYPHEEDMYFFVLLSISIGLIFRSNIMRRAALLIIYILMCFIFVQFMEESMRLMRQYGCIGTFIGYGINYDSLIYPQKILKFMSTFFLIIFIPMIFIYVLSNEESFTLYKVTRRTYKKETLILLLLSIIVTIFFVIELTSPKTFKTITIYPSNNKKLY